MASSDQPSSDSSPALGKIQLKRVAVTTSSGGPAVGGAAARPGASRPMNRLVPYLDLFARLSDSELSRLAQVPVAVAAELRKQVDEICAALAGYADLLPRLCDEELVRLTGASPKTIRFWRLCQPRAAGAPVPADGQISAPLDMETPVQPGPAATPEPEPQANDDAGFILTVQD